MKTNRKPIFTLSHPFSLSQNAITNLKESIPDEIKQEYHVIIMDEGMKSELHSGIDWARLQAIADEMGISQSDFWSMTLSEFNDKLNETT